MNNDRKDAKDQISKEKETKWFEFPLLFLVIILGVCAVFIGISRDAAFIELSRIQKSAIEFEKLSGEIIHLDEKLTMAVKIFTITGDNEWEQVYTSTENELSDKIILYINQFPEIKVTRETDIANQLLVEMERRSLSLVNNQMRDLASEVLNSKEYKKQKDIFKFGISKAKKDLEILINDRTKTIEQKSMGLGALAILFLIFSVIGWIAVFIRLKGINSQLSELSQSLEHKVKLRTDQLNEMQEARLKSANQFKILFQSTPNPILIYSSKGILDCNFAAIKLLGAHNKENLIDKKTEDLSPEFQDEGVSSIEKSQEMISLARINGRHQFEWSYKKFDGTIIPVEVTLAPLEWDGDSVIIALWNDLTDKRRRDLLAIQSSKMASLGQMSAGIAHEINNPLAIIESAVNLLPRFINNSEKFNAKIEMINKSVIRISKIISGLRKFSRSGELSKFSDMSLINMINEAIVLIESKAKRHDTTITLEIQSDCSINCNDVEIEQVLVNLISNSIDAVKNKKNRWVKITVREEGPFAVLSVIDSGNGISNSGREKLFEPFYTTKPVGEGTGLGLAISKGIIEEHNASIQLLDKSMNTTFELKFVKAEKKNDKAS